MTAARQEMNRIGQFLCILAMLALGTGIGQAGTSERLVTDRFSGLAVSGFDPVAYFTEGSPARGREAFELTEGGAIWRFRNQGNRDSFSANPEIYAPQFGGYDPVDVARGVARAGQPQIWAIVDRRLYLFADEPNRDGFLAADAGLKQAAFARWADVQALLAR